MDNHFARGFHEAMRLLKELDAKGNLTSVEMLEVKFLVEAYVNAYEAGWRPFRMP
jgi:hypothetical protein